MASFKVMSRNSDLSSSTQPSQLNTTTPNYAHSMNLDGTFPNSSEPTLLGAHITLVDTSTAAVKEEAVDGMMTLEEFLDKAGSDADVMAGGFEFDPALVFSGAFSGDGSVVGVGEGVGRSGRGRGKRGRGVIVESLDKAALQRQRRMIKNRESAARSRERKQARQNELEALVRSLEYENFQLLNEMAERNKERLKELEKQIVPVVEKGRPKRSLRRVASWHL